MSRFDRDGISFDAPDGWLDLNMVTVEKVPAPPSPEVCTFTVSNEPLGQSESLRSRAQKKLMSVSVGLPGFEYVDTVDGELGGKTSIVIHYKWGEEGAQFLQTLIAVENVKHGRRSAIVIITTSSAREDAAHESAFEKVRGSFRFASNGA